MSGYLIAEVWCEDCGLRVVAEDEGTLRAFRADLRAEGWRRIKDHDKGGLMDICASCAETLAPPNLSASDATPNGSSVDATSGDAGAHDATRDEVGPA